jgi:hypothetical protein
MKSSVSPGLGSPRLIRGQISGAALFACTQVGPAPDFAGRFSEYPFSILNVD